MRFILQRLGFYAVALWVSVTLNFVLPRVMPGSPIDYFISKYHDQLRNNPHALDSLRVMLGGTNEPLPLQYLHYLGNLAHGDFGVSYSFFPVRVSAIIASTLPWTIFLVGAASVLSFVLGTLIGTVAAWRRGGVVDTLLPPITMFSSSFPYFFIAMLLLYVFSFNAGWFPLQHAYGDNVQAGLNGPFLADALYHAALPMLSIVLTSIGGWLLGMRNTMINTLSDDFITMAEAKGLSERRIMLAYAARNALLPNITGFAMSLGFVVSGAILVEYVFSYPGVGYTLVAATQAEDYPLMQALLLLISVGVLAANLIADLLYARLDPRVRV